MTIAAIGRIAAAAATAAVLTVAMPAQVFADPIAAPAKQQAQTKLTRYCVVDPIIGSRLTRKTCKTRAEWLRDEHFDPVTERMTMHR